MPPLLKAAAPPLLAALLAPLMFAGERAEFAMGTTLRVMTEGDAPQGVVDRAVAEIHRLEAMLTTYRAESLVSRLNRRDPSLPVGRDGEGTWYEVPRELHELLRECRRLHEATGGGFDPTVHALVEAWGFETREPRVPSKKRLKRALAGVGMKNVLLADDPPRLRFLRPETKLNFGAVGKGFAMDRAAAVLKGAGVKSGAVEFGRSYLAWGAPLDVELAVSVSHSGAGTPPLVLTLGDGAFASSSQGARFFTKRGRGYGHILDPRTGRPAESGLLLAAVLAPTATEADALSTGFFVLGGEAARAAAPSLEGVEAVFVGAAHGAEEADILFTSGFRHGKETHGPAQ